MTRRHDIDALRALAFALLILYHCALPFIEGEDWHIESIHRTDWLHAPQLFVNRWRMLLIFLISGLSVHFLLQRLSTMRFALSRTWRLLLPLVFGMFVVVPVQPYAEGVANGLVEPGFVDFLVRYYRLGPWPEGAFDGSDDGITWGHLWYLAYLWAYTMVFALLLPVLRSRVGERVRHALIGLRGWPLLLWPALPFLIATVTLQPHFEETGDLIHDWYRNAIYFTAFLYGWWIGTDADIWAELARLRRRSLALALGLFAVYYALVLQEYEGEPAWLELTVWTLRNFFIWAMLCAILGWARVLLDRPWPWLRWANDSVYPWYVLHQSLTILLVFWLAPLRLGPVLEPLLTVGGTVFGCWAISDGLIRRIPWLRPLFGLKPRRPATPAEGTALAGVWQRRVEQPDAKPR